LGTSPPNGDGGGLGDFSTTGSFIPYKESLPATTVDLGTEGDLGTSRRPGGLSPTMSATSHHVASAFLGSGDGGGLGDFPAAGWAFPYNVGDFSPCCVCMIADILVGWGVQVVWGRT
jgi:hypothetical protein